MSASRICPKNATTRFASLSHVYHTYHVSYVSHITNVCVSNLPQKCDQLFLRPCLMCSDVSCTIRTIYNKCMRLKFAPKMRPTRLPLCLMSYIRCATCIIYNKCMLLKFAQKCDQLCCDLVSCVAYVSCTTRIIYNTCMRLKFCHRNVTNSFATLSHVVYTMYHMYHM